MLLHRFSVLTVSASLALCCAGLARADVTVVQKITSDGFGPIKFGAMTGSNTTAIAGDRSRVDGNLQFNSKILRMFQHGTGNTVSVIRLDKELEYEIDPAKKQYSEVTFAQMRAAAERRAQEAKEKGSTTEKEQPSGAPVKESDCKWSPPRTEVTRSADSRTIAGAEAKRVTVSVTTTCEDTKDNTSCDFVYLIDQWLTPERPGAAETRAFWTSYAKKRDLSGELAAAMQGNAQQVFQRYKGSWSEAMAKAGTLKGYSMKSTFAMQIGGPKCKSAQGSKDSSQSESTPPPTSPSDAVGGLAMGLFKKFQKKPDETPPADATPISPDMTQIFGLTTEIASISTDSIPGSQFEPPDGYTKIDNGLAK
jgi:hypothetical protein